MVKSKAAVSVSHDRRAQTTEPTFTKIVKNFTIFFNFVTIFGFIKRNAFK